MLARALIVTGVLGLTACSSEIDPKIIAAYASATCLPSGGDRTREWDVERQLPDGTSIRIHGAGMVGNGIYVRVLSTGREFEAAHAGDYIYPADVRIDERTDTLYVKADGLAGGIWEQTWLFEYALREKRLIAKGQVDAEKLPPECPAPATTPAARIRK